MAHGAFTDKRHAPSEQEISRRLGKSAPLWNLLIAFVREELSTREDLKFYGVNYGWALRFRHHGKALISFYPGTGAFEAQIILSEGAVQRALRMPLGARYHLKIRSAHPYPEGRWLFLDVLSPSDVKRIEELILLKVAGKRKKPRLLDGSSMRPSSCSGVA
jgi:hypothetical protein